MAQVFQGKHVGATRKDKSPDRLIINNVPLTYYFRHLKDIFTGAGILGIEENKVAVDKAIHKIVGVNYQNCPLVWRKAKESLVKSVEVSTFISELKKMVYST